MNVLDNTPRALRLGMAALLSCALLVICLPSTGWAQVTSIDDLSQPDQAKLVNLLQEGNTAFNSGQYDDALKHYDGALASITELKTRFPDFAMNSLAAAGTGAWLAGRASEIAVASWGHSEQSLLATDTVSALGSAFRELRGRTAA